MKRLLIMGLDPGVRGSSTGVAIVELLGDRGVVLEAYTTSIHCAARLVNSVEPHVLVVDSPLSPPTVGVWRSVDLLARRLGLRVLPPGWRGMKMLVEATLNLLESIEPKPLVLETHPSSVLRVAGCSLEKLLEGLGCVVLAKPSTSHERDALIAACVGVAFAKGYWARLEARDGSIWLVDPIVCRYPPAANAPNSLLDEASCVA